MNQDLKNLLTAVKAYQAAARKWAAVDNPIAIHGITGKPYFRRCSELHSRDAAWMELKRIAAEVEKRYE